MGEIATVEFVFTNSDLGAMVNNIYSALRRAKLSTKTSAKKVRSSPKKKKAASKPPAPSAGGSRTVKKTITKQSEPRKTYGSMAMAVDATRPSHIPPPIPLGPYSVLHGRRTISLSTSTTGNTVVLCGPHTVSSSGLRDIAISPIVAVSGVGTGVPGSAPEDYFTDSLVGTYASTLTGNVANGNLHALTIVVNCLSPTTVVQGQVYVGSLNQRVNRSRYATYDDLANAMINRREIQPHSAYNILSSPVKFSCYPVDIADWARQFPLVFQSNTLSENITMDSLSQLAVVLPPTTASVSYSITIYTEWRINFVDPALASTATTKPASSMDIWSSIAAVGSETSGFIQKVEGGIAALGALSGAASAGAGLVSTLGLML